MNELYWSRVGNKLKSLAQNALALAVPVAVDYAIIKTVEKICLVIEKKLNMIFIRTGINTFISFFMNVCGLLTLVYKPFGVSVSKGIAIGLFFISFIFWLVRLVCFMINYSKEIYYISESIIKEKSVSLGLENYILKHFPMISLTYTGISIGTKYIPVLAEIPRISEFIHYVISIFWKRIFVFVGAMILYTVFFIWILKPFLIRIYLN